MLNKKHKNNAKVIDGKLILSFPSAVKPVVWQMDLLDVKASALEINDNEKDGYDLVLKTLKGEAVHVASFAEKAEGVHGLMAAAKAMESAQGQIFARQACDMSAKSGAAQPSPVAFSSRRGRGVFKTVLWVLAGLVVIFVLMNILARVTPSANGGRSSSGFEQSSSLNAPPQSGVPVSADDFLRKR